MTLPYGIPPAFAQYRRILFSPSASPKSTTSESTDDGIRKEKPSNVKPLRPFKAFPKDSLQLAIEISTRDSILGSSSSVEAYSEFRKNIFTHMKIDSNINKSMRRYHSPSDRSDDLVYLEKRKKNNEAARRSRESRRAKEDEVAIRCAFLEQENIRLKLRIAVLESESNNLKSLLRMY
ncbi:hypothetical protein NQ317_018147 [Molorchus minor]|uniref:BZIP domain-containing protein n=1 Tax=Molorchus minor TaxID=1323400 RepID=A0ABQ9IRN6_9CUCU|nr:hypothetical protein NQ317_018147 [Molorchus minor]